MDREPNYPTMEEILFSKPEVGSLCAIMRQTFEMAVVFSAQLGWNDLGASMACPRV